MKKEQINPADAHQILLIIWISLLISQFLFLMLVYFIKPEVLRFDLSRPLLGKDAVVVAVIGLMAVTDLVISFVMKKRYLDQAVSEQSVGLVQTAMIIGCALCESVSLFGLLLAFAFNYPYFWIFSALGIIGTLFHFPSKKNVDAASFRTVL
ncbi:MAG TPA: hypothetical protein VGQ55_16940 [Pyrinomonadaceae bacterium]|jgi:hypothetical protein|nr:hypothetical protein [Pyrinomonadaceae bacterium]